MNIVQTTAWQTKLAWLVFFLLNRLGNLVGELARLERRCFLTGVLARV
jgi:hypothetical protein